ncbi:MAG: tRNA pseudouridine(38-40) synthase TruA [Bacillota bacterium]|jgi:tRNA pseudouridine38-40 synthase
MRNIKLTIQYDGAAYIGWQSQPDFHGISIQQTIERALKKVVGQKVEIFASGRTDAGVSALGQVANFQTMNIIPLERLQLALNNALPTDIRISNVQEMPADFHARYSSISKTYCYTIDRSQKINVFRGHWAWRVKDKLDLDVMRQVARLFLGEHDFKQFCASGGSAKTSVRTIDSLKIIEGCYEKELPWLALTNPVVIEIVGAGFLYKMVRFIVARLVAVAQGKLTYAEVEQLLHNQLTKPIKPAPAGGLILKEVQYEKKYL